MPVKSNRRDQKRILAKRISRSLSPQKKSIINNLEFKKNSSAILDKFENDTDSDQCNQSDTFPNILKQLHSDFNKKYISDKVTIDSKLRWNRNVQQSPVQNEIQSSLRNILLRGAKQSPQIASPLYSPIKPLKKQVEEVDQQLNLSVSFETPPSSNESDSPKSSQSKRKIKNSNLIFTCQKFNQSENLTKSCSPKHTRKQKYSNSSEKFLTINESKKMYSENSMKKKISIKKSIEVENESKSRIKQYQKAVSKAENMEYFVNEEHLNMENILETDSEKSDFPTTRSPTSMSLCILSTSSPDSTITNEVQLEPSYFENEKVYYQTEIENNLTLKNNSKNKNQIKINIPENDSKMTCNIKNIETLVPVIQTSNNINEDMFQSSKKNTRDNLTKSVEIQLLPKIHSFTSGETGNTKNSFLFNSESFISNELRKDSFQHNNEIDEGRKSKLEGNYTQFYSNENNETQDALGSVQINETFHYPILHNRISSLKSPLSTDSAHGSSIDVETNYHPKHCEIFWGRKGSFPFWPCLIWPDPEGKTLRIEKQGHRQYISYHVKFFADNGQRSWIYKDNLIAYNGREDFERRAKEQSVKMKPSVFKKCFVVSRAKLAIWEQAVKEADRILCVHIEKRAEIFDQVLKESMELLRMHKQQRRLSLSVDRNSSLFSNISNVGSSEDFLNTSGISSSLSIVSKRRRSSSIYDNLAKRHKIESDSEDVLQQETLTTINTDSNKYVFPKELIEILADYTLKTTENEESFRRFENCCIDLFHIVKDSIHEEHKRETNVKKHPNRLLRKTLVDKLKKHYNEILSKPSVKVEKVKKKRAILDVPAIQSVLKDIIDLLQDKQYLFRHLKKGPVCIICLKPNDLFKCSGHCDSWIHKHCCNFTCEEYFAKLKEEAKGRRGKKSAIKNKLPQREVENNDSFNVHITGDDDEHFINTKRHEEMYVDNQIEVINGDLDGILEKVTCKLCSIYIKPFCVLCKTYDNEENYLESINSNSKELLNIVVSSTEKQTLMKCKLPSCNKYYHLNCLKLWPQSYITRTNKGNSNFEKTELLCPSHTCHTCVSDDPHHIQLGKNNIIKCVKCPATYHLYSKCVPAGTEFLTANTIICARHGEETKPTNTDWCFLCSGSGNLICCDSCPSSFHLSCLKLSQPPKEKYLCELCQNGCLPLYGDLVWCKFGQYKWWPSVIIPPPIIPKNLFNKTHSRFGFCVRFLGTHDYGWTGRHRVYLYQEDDYSSDRKKDKALQKAIDEAKTAWDYFEINKPKKGDFEDDFIPLPYKKIKSNLPVLPVKLEYDISELNPCNCLPDSDSPCGYNSQCLNRVLMIECHPKICPAKHKCENQMFEKRQYVSLTIRKTAGKGFGLVCTETISAGSFIIEYVGELIDDNELKRRIEAKQKEKDSHYYFFSIESNLTIDAGPKGNLARFMNHSCEPNCEPQMWTVNGVKRIGLFAKYDIKEDSELTFHYNFECVGDNKVLCHCGAENCKGFIDGIYNKKSNELKNLSQDKNTDTETSSKTTLIPKQKKVMKNNSR